MERERGASTIGEMKNQTEHLTKTISPRRSTDEREEKGVARPEGGREREREREAVRESGRKKSGNK